MRYLVTLRWEPFVDPRIHLSHLKLLYWLGQHANKEGRCWPSLRLLARKSGVHLRTVCRCLADLEFWGYVHVERSERDHGGAAANVYAINLTFPIEGIPAQTARGGGPSFTDADYGETPDAVDVDADTPVDMHVNTPVAAPPMNAATPCCTEKILNSAPKRSDDNDLSNAAREPSVQQNIPLNPHLNGKDGLSNDNPAQPRETRNTVIGLVISRLYLGRRPPERDVRMNAQILTHMHKKGRSWEDLARIVEGLALRRDRGELHRVGKTDPVSLKWLIAKSQTLNQAAVCEDALYQGQPARSIASLAALLRPLANLSSGISP